MHPTPGHEAQSTDAAQAVDRAAGHPGSGGVRHWLRVIWPFLTALLLLLALAAGSLELMSAGRAYVEGESLWSKGQKTAIVALAHFVESCDAGDFAAYETAIAAPMGYRQARLALSQPVPDRDSARAGFLAGGSHPADVQRMVEVFVHLGRAPLIRDALAIWGEAEASLLVIDQRARLIHEDLRRQCGATPRHRALLDELYHLNERLTPLQTRFTDTLGQANRLFQTLLLAVMAAASLVLAAAGAALSLRVVRRGVAAEHALRDELDHRRAAQRTLQAALSALAPVRGGMPADGASPSEDIEAVTRAVAALAERHQAAHQQLSAILALSPDAFVSFDAAGVVRHVSPAFADITGLAPQAVLGRPEPEFTARVSAQCRPPDAMPALATLRTHTAGEPVLLHLAGAAHRVLRVELREGEGDAVHSVLCLRDITREQALERLKSEFMSTAAHELRTPMASIFGFVELMRLRRMDEARRTELLDIVHRQSRLMISIIDDLLDLARLEAHRGEERPRAPVSVAGLVDRALRDFSAPEGRDPPQRVQGAAAPDTVLGDTNQLRRVLNNLLSNAYKYSPAGGPVHVTVLADPTGAPRLGLRVTDTGIGMTPEQLARVGERFYRADASGRLPGTGLGMSIVGEIVRAHGGTLTLASVPGQGTEVTVWLQAANAAHGPQGVAQRKLAADSTSPPA